MTSRSGRTDFAVFHHGDQVGGAKTVTDRNLRFLGQAAALAGHRLHPVNAAADWRGGRDLPDRLCYLLFRLPRDRLALLMRAVWAGQAGHVWFDFGAFGLSLALLRLIRGGARLRGRPGARLHLFHHNDEYRYQSDADRAAGRDRHPKARLRRGLIWLQQTVGRQAADANYYISPAERRPGPAMVLPPSWPARDRIPAAERRDHVLLIGSRFFANEHGFRWYIDHVAAQIPAPTLIAGRGMDQAFTSGGQVTVLGFVPDLDALYDAARIVAVPIFRGAGTKVKLVEALHAGCQVIATPEACDGIADQASLIASGQLIRAAGPDFAACLTAELARPAPRFPGGGYADARFLPAFLALYGGG